MGKRTNKVIERNLIVVICDNAGKRVIRASKIWTYKPKLIFQRITVVTRKIDLRRK